VTIIFLAITISQGAKKPSPVQVNPVGHLQAVYDQTNALKLKRDVVSLEKVLRETHTTDYIFYGRSGKSTLDQVINGMKSAMEHISSATQATTKIEKFVRTPEGGIATVRTFFVFTTKPMDDGRTHVISEQIVGQDRWISRGPNWSLKMSKTTSEKFLRDGQPLR